MQDLLRIVRWSTAAAALLGLCGLVAGCSADPSTPGATDAGNGSNGSACATPCECNQVCDERTGFCIPRDCGKSEDPACADEANLEWDPDMECVDGRVVAPACESDGDCAPMRDTHPRVCEAGRCIKGCRPDEQQCPQLDGKAQRCDGENTEVTGGGPAWCRQCECAIDLDCPEQHPEGIWACFADSARDDRNDCMCHEVDCRCGFADCDEGLECDCSSLTGVPTKCETDDDCVDPQKFCRGDIERCVCCDGVSTGVCAAEDNCCRDTDYCHEGFGATYICNAEHTCVEEPCTDDTQCTTLGTACDLESNLCAPIPCERDTDCPRRTDIRPLPNGIFWCDADSGVCTQGCREDSDCPENRRCAEDHGCEARLCTEVADCEPGRWCRGDSPDLPEGSPEGTGICQEGCDEPSDCPANQPCRLDVHGCGCVGDSDCAILDPTFVCEAGGICIPPCLEHTDCQVAEACIAGHCREGACRNDEFEVSSAECPSNDASSCAFEPPLEADEEDACENIGIFDARICSERPEDPDLPIDLADWYVFQLGQYDELSVEVIWPLVDSDGDGQGDTPGACNLQDANLSVKLWRGRGAGQALEWPAPGWELDPPDVNEPCRLTATTKVAAPQAQAYYLSVENLSFTSADYRLQVSHACTVECEADNWEPNDEWDDAPELFDCGRFIATGGFIGQPDVIDEPMFCRDDKDIYRLHLREEDQLQITGRYDSRRGELRARLFHPIEFLGEDAMFAFQDVAGDDGEFTLIEDGGQVVVEGDYLLEITAPRAYRVNPAVPTETPYTLELACEGPRAPCVRDPFEDNDRPEQAHCIDPAGCDRACGRDQYVFEYPRPGENDAQLHLCEDGLAQDGRDEDWYRIQVNPDSAISVLAENELGEAGAWNIEVEIVQVNGNQWAVLGRSADAGAINEVSAANLAAGAYYVRILHPLNAPERTVPYRLRITVHCTPPECNEDNYEENDVLADAPELPIVPAPPHEAEFLCYPRNESNLALCRPGAGEPEERDYYKIDLRDVMAERLEVEVRCADPEAGDLNLELRKEEIGELDGRLACPQNIPPDGECRDIRPGDCASDPARYAKTTLQAPSADWHYLKVFGFNDPQNEYDLCIKVVENECDNEDEWEENDTCQDPAEARVNHHEARRAKICPQDEDWWWFDTPEEGFIRIRAEFFGGADIDIQVIDKTCSTIRGVLAEDLTQSRMPCLQLQNVPADRYSVRLWGADALSEAEYNLDVQFSPNFLPCF